MSKDDRIKELAEKHLLLKELTEHPGWSLLWREAGPQIELRYRHLRVGLEDQNKYMQAVGWLDGVEYLQKIPGEVLRQLERITAEDG